MRYRESSLHTTLSITLTPCKSMEGRLIFLGDLYSFRSGINSRIYWWSIVSLQQMRKYNEIANIGSPSIIFKYMNLYLPFVILLNCWASDFLLPEWSSIAFPTQLFSFSSLIIFTWCYETHTRLFLGTFFWQKSVPIIKARIWQCEYDPCLGIFRLKMVPMSSNF